MNSQASKISNKDASDKTQANDLDQLAINTIRFLSVDAVQNANSGHPGMPMDAAPMAYVLWTRYLKFNPRDPAWFDRDRFILSAGHGSMLLYSLLYLTGYDLSLEQIKHFRQWESLTPGHPERGLTPGVEITTGPLGQGFGNGVGMAIAEAHLAARYNRPGYEIINHYTYGIVSDGDLMEGVSSESASLAGTLNLGKLIYLYDNNHVTLSAATDLTFREDVAGRFQAYGWQTITVEDGNDITEIDQALNEARENIKQPSLIICRTHLGYGSPHKQDTWEAHGNPLGPEEVKLTKENLGWPVDPPFYIPEQSLREFRKAIDRGARMELEWESLFRRYAGDHPDLAKEIQSMLQEQFPEGWDTDLPRFPADPKGMATRVASGEVMNAIALKIPGLIGGSGDLDPSTYTALKGAGDFEAPDGSSNYDAQGSAGGGWSYAGRNIHFGVREHGMGAILNGIGSFPGLIPYGATFLIFSDYMRPPMRLASLMKLHVIYIFTHDSIALGQDGPTHQPVEQLVNLRAIPNFTVIRPADANETRVAWQVAIETHSRPVALVLTRQHVPTLDRSKFASEEGLRKGAYILADAPGGTPDVILIATGSEVSLIVQAQEKLRDQNVRARIVSMPSWELFEEQPLEYRSTVLPPDVKARLSVEAGSPQGWERYVGPEGAVIGLNHFGASAPGDVVLDKFGFTVDHVVDAALEITGRKGMER
ncbi:MAG: transketolase [Chloroflexi bacterium]|nr:transketolase [Chloroflexota bacterium]